MTDKMPPDETNDVPLTKEQLVEQIHQLTERARAAGLHPIKTLIQTYTRQARATLEGILASLDNEGSSKKKR